MPAHPASARDDITTADGPSRGLGPDIGYGSAMHQLAEAERASRLLPAAMPAAFVTFGMLCAIGGLSTLGFRLAALVGPMPGFDARLAVLISVLSWVFVSMLPIVLIRDRWRRGLGRRWILLMTVWSALWIAGMLTAQSSWAALVLGPLFLGLFAVAIVWEAAATGRAGIDLHKDAR